MKGHNGAVFCSLLFNILEKKAIMISWRGGKTEASPCAANHGWKEKLLYEGDVWGCR